MSSPSPTPSRRAASTSPSQSHSPATRSPSNSDSDSDDAPVQVPRGKLAARLLGGSASRNTSSSDDGLDAYQRIKKQLMSGNGTTQSDDKETAPPATSSKASSEDEEDMPVQGNRFRRLAQRVARKRTSQRTPSPTVMSHQSSPGLFVSPHSASKQSSPPRDSANADSDSDLPDPDHRVAFQERVARIRANRKAKEEETQKQEAAKSKRVQKASNRARRTEQAESEDDDRNGDAGRRLTQQARPTRKASKKALEELSRETQRMNRNMQLAHQAKTKKKYGVKDLFAKFNYIPEGTEAPDHTSDAPDPTTSPAFASSDVEMNHHETPPTSPPGQDDLLHKDERTEQVETISNGPAAALEAPSVENIAVSVPRLDKGKGRAPEFQHLPVNPLIEKTAAAQIAPPTTARNTRVHLSKLAGSKEIDLDSDDDLEITNTKSRFPVFDRIPKTKEQDSRSLLNLRHLAHLTSPGRKGIKGRPSMNSTELQTSLQRKAREQAQKERMEKIEELKARGIFVQTDEEREKFQLEMDNLLEKAREDAMKLAKKEKQASKKDGNDDADGGLPSSDESEDGDYQGSGEEEVGDDGQEAEIELSGSEDEEMVDAEEEDDDETESNSNALLDDQADEDEEEEEQAEERVDMDEDEDIDEDNVAPVRKSVPARRRNVIVDEDDEDDDATPKISTPTQAVQNDAMAAFGFEDANAPSLGLTQMFAGTMANLDSQSENTPMPDPDSEENSLDFLRSLPDTQPNLDSAMFGAAQDLEVPNSQGLDSQPQNPESQISLGISQIESQSQAALQQTQMSDVPEPTQDAGFLLSRSPAGLQAPPSTVDTVIMPVAESPIVKKKGRLQRRKEMIAVLSDVDEDESAAPEPESDVDEADKIRDAFNVMRKASKKKQLIDEFNKKTSRAKEMVEEQAEESEDEYAGLGGQSDDESGGEDEEVTKMIDESDVKVDERKLAAYYADKARAEDEKQLNQLYKDIHNGGLRRKRGDDFDLSESEDEAAQRRRKKQMEYQKMRKALLTDEKVGKIAQNPKQSAFFRTLEDHEDDPDFEFLDAPEMDMNEEAEDSTPSEQVSVPDSQQHGTSSAAPSKAIQANPLKRKPDSDSQKENRPPPHLRRTAANDTIRKPITIAEIRESVSFLIEEPNSIPDSQMELSDSEGEAEPLKKALRNPIVDRLTLSRQSSLTEETAITTTAQGNLAFHAPSSKSHQPGFRIPSLVRRATSNVSAASSTTTGSAANTAGVEGGGVRRGGSARSNIHAQAREAERRKAVEKVDLRRSEALRRKVRGKRAERSVLGMLDGGFE